MSQIRVSTVANTGGGSGVTPEQMYNGRSRAWVNFNGQGTASIRRGYNVNSIGDAGTGFFTINFSIDVGANHCVLGSHSYDSPHDDTAYTGVMETYPSSSTSAKISTRSFTGQRYDCEYNAVSSFSNA